MKILNKVIALTAMGTLLFGSCKDALDTQPRQSISSDIALTSVAGIQGLLNDTYGSLRNGLYYGRVMKIVPDILSDNVYPLPGNNSNRLILESTNVARAHINIWAPVYSTINRTNLIIDAVENTANISQADAAKLKGEALFIRALCYFDLVRTYSYNPLHIQNGFDLGVPIILKPAKGLSEITLPSRPKVTENYTQIESDLLAAEGLLGNTGGPFLATKGAVQALLAKVYLYWGKYPQSVTAATNAIASSNFATLQTNANYASMFTKATNPEAVFQIAFTNPENLGNESLQSYYNQLPGNIGYGDFSPSAELLATYEANDVRRTIITSYVKSGQTVLYGRKWNPTKGTNYWHDVTVTRISEVYLTRAEAAARGGNTAQALTDLATIRTRAGVAPIFPAGTALIDAILKERRLELAFEGERWYDLTRLGLDIPKAAILNTPTVPFTDYRILAPLPIGELGINPNLVKNPGY